MRCCLQLEAAIGAELDAPRLQIHKCRQYSRYGMMDLLLPAAHPRNQLYPQPISAVNVAALVDSESSPFFLPGSADVVVIRSLLPLEMRPCQLRERCRNWYFPRVRHLASIMSGEMQPSASLVARPDPSPLAWVMRVV